MPTYSTVLAISLIGTSIVATGASIDLARRENIHRRIDGAFTISTMATSAAGAALAAGLRSGRGDRLPIATGPVDAATAEQRLDPATSSLIRVRLGDAPPTETF